MLRRSWNIRLKVIKRYLPYLFFSLLLILVSVVSYSINYSEPDISIRPLNTEAVLSSYYIPFVLTLLGMLIVICALVVFFSIRLKRVNRELQERNKQILDFNVAMERTNNTIAIEKEFITKEHYESDKFYGMLVQSADDGISFYDRDWNLKYANSAFYTMIGLDRDSYNSLDPKVLIHPEDADYHSKRMQVLNIKGFFESELRIRHKEGYYINLSTRSVTVRSDNGDVLGSLTI
jgi:PAS domain S-box-containing protein